MILLFKIFLLFKAFIKNALHTLVETIITGLNTLVTLFVYIIGIGMTSLAAKLCRKHFLNLCPPPKNTHWIIKEQKPHTLREHQRQF